MPDKPNIVIINPDQMRWDYMTPAGHPFIETTGISRLAEIGVAFNSAFASAPACGPSRISFVTGLYPSEHLSRDFAGAYDKRKPNVLHNLGQAGYRRALFGKDHIIAENAIGILYDEGEDICLGSMSGHPANTNVLSIATLERGSKWDLTERLTTAAIRYIEAHADSAAPFYVTINYQDPHPLFACPEPYASLFHPDQFRLPGNFRRSPAEREIRRLGLWRTHSGTDRMEERAFLQAMAMYCGQIRYVDDQVHRVLDALGQLGILSRTIVLFWSDHGEFLGDFGVARKIPAFYDCLMRIPMILYDPAGRIDRTREDHFVEAMDIMATIADMAGVPQPKGSRAQSLLSTDYRPRADVFGEGGLYRQPPAGPIDGLFLRDAGPPTNWGPGAMLRTPEWKLCLYAHDDGELYDLRNDPLETRNLSGDPQYGFVEDPLRERLARRLLCKGQAPEHLPVE
jgi:arylsulfatase A-like enzyme